MMAKFHAFMPQNVPLEFVISKWQKLGALHFKSMVLFILCIFFLHFKIKTSDKIFRRFDLAEIIFKFEKNE